MECLTPPILKLWITEVTPTGIGLGNAESGDNMNKLPPEIWNQIINELYDHHNALEACSLTCCSWTYHSQTHIHHTIALVCTPNFQGPFADDRYSTPRVARMVRHLRLTLLPRVTVFVARPKVWQVLNRLHHVDTLMVCQGSWNYGQPDKVQFVDVFRNVVSLDLFWCDYESPDNFLAFISGFPSLTKLHLFDTFWQGNKSWDWTPSTADPPGKQIHTFIISGDCEFNEDWDFLRFLAKWFSLLSDVTTHDITLNWRAQFPFEALSLLLCGLGTSLAHLRVNMIYQPLSFLSSFQ